MTTTTDWKQVHEQLLAIAAERAGLDRDEGRWLLRALRLRVHEELGYASFIEYIGRLFGYSPRFIGERLRVAQALESLPVLSDALGAGEVSWSAVRELARVATVETEAAWLAAARNKTVRELERLVAGLELGARPGDAPVPAAERHVVRFELSAETWATFREAIRTVQRDAGAPLDEDALLLLMARRVLGGPKDEGRAPYQVALTVCERCGHGAQRGRGEEVVVGAEVVEMAECDAQHVTHVGRATQTIPPAVRRQVVQRDQGRCVVPGCRHATHVDVHHLIPRSEGGRHDPDGLAVVCAAHHRALHRGTLVVEGRVATGLTFLHADGTAYGAGAVTPERAEAQTDAFQALKQLGFKETEARRALAELRGVVLPAGELVRAALQRLYPAAKASCVRERRAPYGRAAA